MIAAVAVIPVLTAIGIILKIIDPAVSLGICSDISFLKASKTDNPEDIIIIAILLLSYHLLYL